MYIIDQVSLVRLEGPEIRGLWYESWQLDHIFISYIHIRSISYIIK